MAKEHKKIPKVKNAPRKICSPSEIMSNGNIICTTFSAVVGCKSQRSPCDFQGLVFLGKGAGGKHQRLSFSAPVPGELRQCVRLCRSSTTEGGFEELICRVNEKAQVANWILITSRRLFGTTVLFHSSEKSTNVHSKKVPFLAKKYGSK